MDIVDNILGTVEDNVASADNGKPMIMLIAEKGSMGSTFPNSFICFDLRACDLNKVTDFTTLIQDVGRVSGYGHTPDLLISAEANSFLKNVWNEEQGDINLENLRNELELKLGANMIQSKSVAINNSENTASTYPQVMENQECM